jgi:small multidrug resistance pump
VTPRWEIRPHEGKTLAILVAAAMSAVGILGDYFLKRASQEEQPLATKAFLVGFVLYASTAVAWTYVMRHLTLATIGVIYAMCMILLLALMGVGVFDEPLRRYEVVGIGLVLTALILLSYPKTPDISRNGQAVMITFTDFKVDVVPAFYRNG